MRIDIDFCTDRNEIVLICETSDDTCAESRINFFVTKTDSVTVRLERNGTIVDEALQVNRSSACYVLDDALMRTPGEFVVYATACMPMRFVVAEAIANEAEYSINLTNGVFYVRAASTSNGNAGDAPTIEVEETDDGVRITVTGQNGTKTVLVPAGSKGDAATVEVGSVTTLPAGSEATVTNAGTKYNAVLNFGIPKGADGAGGGTSGEGDYGYLDVRLGSMETKIKNMKDDINYLWEYFDEFEVFALEYIYKIGFRVARLERHLGLTPPVNENIDTTLPGIDDAYDDVFPE